MAKRKVEAEVPVESPVSFSKTGLAQIPGLKIDTMRVLIVGTAILVVHKFSEKVRKQVLDKHMKVATRGGREAKDPNANFEAARYRLFDSTDGFPAGGLKACIVNATGKDTSGVPRTKAVGMIRVKPDDMKQNLCRIIVPEGQPEMREDVVRNESGVIDIRHRPSYWPWCMVLQLEYLPDFMSSLQVLQCIEMAGYSVGLGEGRPKSRESLSGTWGTFRTAKREEIELFEARDGRFWDLLAPTPVAQAAE